MLRTIQMVGLSTILLAGTALAAIQPTPINGDPHVQTVVFDPTKQISVYSAVGRPLTIAFGEKESIRRVSLEPDMPGLDGKTIPAPIQGPTPEQMASAPLGHILPLWGMRAGRSSGQVVTDTETGKNRIYQFRFIVLAPQPNTCPPAEKGMEDCDDPRLTAGLTLSYPGERKLEDKQAIELIKAEKLEQAAKDRLRTDLFYGPRHQDYLGQGNPDAKQALAPDAVSDNKQVTGFLYLGRREAPAIYIVTPGEHGKPDDERQVSPIPDQDLLVVYETACHWRLRRAPYVFDVWPKTCDQTGENPWTGTTSPNVVREIRSVSKASSR